MNGKTNEKYRILVIDDNEAIHNDLKRILCAGADDAGSLGDLEMELFGDTKDKITNSQFDLQCALQGMEGFELVKSALNAEDPFALAFVDVRMPPGWDGIETIAHIRELDTEMQVVVCTAYSDYSSDEIIAKVGNADNLFILKKPFDNVEILQMANALTKKWSLHRELRGKMFDLESIVKERTQALETANEELRTQLAQREQLYAERQLDRSLKAVGQIAEGITKEITQPVQNLGSKIQKVREMHEKVLSHLTSMKKLWNDSGAESSRLAADLMGVEKELDIDNLIEASQISFSSINQDLAHVQGVVEAAVEVGQADQGSMAMADVNQMLNHALILTRYQYKDAADVLVDFGELEKITCNVSQIYQVLINLLGNAALASRDAHHEDRQRKTIWVSTRQEGKQVVVTIQDQGKGIPGHLKDVYDQILKADDLGKYAGQGLAIARSIIVDGHGGRLDFDSQENQGTMITIRLPVNPPK